MSFIINFENWRDKYGTELEQAKKVISDNEINLVNLSKLTKIPYQTVRNYRYDLTKLDKASWKNINHLSQAFTILTVEKTFMDNNQKEFSKKLAKMFENWKKEAGNNQKQLALLDRMQEIILSDPLAVAELYSSQDNKHSEE